MKATGIVRHVDDLGRVVLPKELRRTLKIATGDPIEFFTDGENIILHKYDTAGDLMQLLERVEHDIQATDPLISPKKLTQLMAKLKEMKTIVREAEKK